MALQLSHLWVGACLAVFDGGHQGCRELSEKSVVASRVSDLPKHWWASSGTGGGWRGIK